MEYVEHQTGFSKGGGNQAFHHSDILAFTWRWTASPQRTRQQQTGSPLAGRRPGAMVSSRCCSFSPKHSWIMTSASSKTPSVGFPNYSSWKRLLVSLPQTNASHVFLCFSAAVLDIFTLNIPVLSASPMHGPYIQQPMLRQLVATGRGTHFAGMMFQDFLWCGMGQKLCDCPYLWRDEHQ